MNSKLLLILSFCSINLSVGQSLSKVEVHFVPLFESQVIRLDSTFFHLGNKETVQFETLKFYVSNISLLQNGKIIYTEKNGFHLVDASSENSLQFSLSITAGEKYDAIFFNLGIDSTTNVSGAMGGDLDPTKGMYWAWQSGYINLKLEGTSSACKTAKHAFEFHLGGYQSPFNALQKIQLNVSSASDINVYLNIDEFLKSIQLAQQNHLMSPGKEAVELSSKIARAFHAK